MHMIRVMVLGAAACAFQGATDLWAGSIYTWTDPNHVVHITETPPPPGVTVDNLMDNPPDFATRAQPSVQQPRSIGSWEVQQAEQLARQAVQQLQQAEKNAQQVKQAAERTIQESTQYIDSHDKNQYMRWAFKYQLKQAGKAISASQVKAQEAADQLKQAEQKADAARQQLQEAQESSKIISKSN